MLEPVQECVRCKAHRADLVGPWQYSTGARCAPCAIPPERTGSYVRRDSEATTPQMTLHGQAPSGLRDAGSAVPAEGFETRWLGDTVMAALKFEEALGRLEEIVQTLERSELSLDESLKAFEEGVKLSKNCLKLLDDAEKRVEVLLGDQGRKRLQSFELPEDGTASSPSVSAGGPAMTGPDDGR